MKTASVSEIRRELKSLPPEKLVELCLRLSRFKKDNKELLDYVLFESQDEESYISTIQEEILDDFESLNVSSLYLAKKTIRKVIRKLNKYTRYSGRLQTVIELNVFFLQRLIEVEQDIKKSKVLTNIFRRRLEVIHKALGKLHPDLQFDYELETEELVSFLR